MSDRAYLGMDNFLYRYNENVVAFKNWRLKKKDYLQNETVTSKLNKELGMVAYSNPSTGKAEVGGVLARPV